MTVKNITYAKTQIVLYLDIHLRDVYIVIPMNNHIITCYPGFIFEPATDINVHVGTEEINLRFSSNSEAKASELLENLEKMFSHYWY